MTWPSITVLPPTAVSVPSSVAPDSTTIEAPIAVTSPRNVCPAVRT